jgi:hypothetical protein
MPNFRVRYRAASYVWAEEIIEASTADMAAEFADARLLADRTSASPVIDWQDSGDVQDPEVQEIKRVS